MRKHSDTFPLVALFAVLALWLFMSTIFGNLFYGVVKAWFEKYTGVQESQVIAGLAQEMFPLLASVCVVWGFYQYARREFQKISIPALKCSFDMKDLGCVHRDITASIMQISDGKIIGTKKCDWYRLRLEAEGGNVSGCHARLISVERDGIKLFGGDSPPLPIAHFGEADATINEGVPQHVDLLTVYEDDTADLCVPAAKRSQSIDWGNMFSQPGNYHITAALVAHDARSALIDLVFKWNLSRASAEIAFAQSHEAF